MPTRKTKKQKRGVIDVRAIDFVMSNVTDMKRAHRFYRDILGLGKGEEYNQFWSEFDTKPTSLCLCGAEPDSDWRGSTAVALAVADIHQTIDALRKKGVKILVEPEETSVCWMAFIADPDGNRICIHQRKNGTAG
jgi:predicted enzyme related to lactoylglutathione lyase